MGYILLFIVIAIYYNRDGQTDVADCVTLRADAVGKKARAITDDIPRVLQA